MGSSQRKQVFAMSNQKIHLHTLKASRIPKNTVYLIKHICENVLALHSCKTHTHTVNVEEFKWELLNQHCSKPKSNVPLEFLDSFISATQGSLAVLLTMAEASPNTISLVTPFGYTLKTLHKGALHATTSIFFPLDHSRGFPRGTVCCSRGNKHTHHHQAHRSPQFITSEYWIPSAKGSIHTLSNIFGSCVSQSPLSEKRAQRF
jgi:hypothetical protein